MMYPTNMQTINVNFLYSELHKNDKSEDLSMHISNLQILSDLSFLCSTEYKVFEVDFLHGCGIHHFIHKG